jgi:cytidylate kinase
MYRAVTSRALREGVSAEDGAALARLAERITFDLNPSVYPSELSVDGGPPEPDVTSPEVESTVSRVARHPEVRAVLRAEQRRLCAGGGVVEGRDIGTVVAPRAEAKIFLEADEAARIARRTDERRIGRDEVGPALSARDALDARTNPLEPAEDAVAMDTTDMDPETVFRTCLVIVRERLAGRRR